MSSQYDDSDLTQEASDEQIAELIELGASESQLDGISAEDADQLIDQLRSLKANARNFNSSP